MPGIVALTPPSAAALDLAPQNDLTAVIGRVVGNRHRSIRVPHRRREKAFGQPSGIPLDRNAKARIKAAVLAYNARHKLAGQHWGPITRATMQVLMTLLWGFHNSRDGRCFPSYESIAARARCARSTVCAAIHALEAAGILTWVHRIARIRVRGADMFGQVTSRWRIIRTSNAYSFRDPHPGAGNRPKQPVSCKSENPPGTEILDSISSRSGEIGMSDAMTAAFARLGATMKAAGRG